MNFINNRISQNLIHFRKCRNSFYDNAFTDLHHNDINKNNDLIFFLILLISQFIYLVYRYYFFMNNHFLFYIISNNITIIFIDIFKMSLIFLIINLLLLFFNIKTNYYKITLLINLIKTFVTLLAIFIISNISNIGFTSSYFIFIYEIVLFYDIYLSFGFNSINMAFILLSDILNIVCILLLYKNIKYKKNLYLIFLLMCNIILTFLFLSLDLISFYIFFEIILIPMFMLIILWGSRNRKIHAVFYFFLYTLVGSLLFLFGILYLHINYKTTNIINLQYINIYKEDQIILWIMFFLAFAIKVPIYPLHLWLPEAHVEAPTTGSVLLAGILLKLGTYGFLKFFFILLPLSSLYFLPLINILCTLGIIYCSFTIIRQIDIKKIIAYSSVIHMNYTILGLFNYNFLSFYGSFYLMLSHGIVSSALFICVGFLYERYHTRIIFYYGNLVMIMPLLTIYFFIFTLGNIGFPGTSSFIGEFLIFAGILQNDMILALLILFGLFVSVIYSFTLFNKTFFYNSINKKKLIIKFSDLNEREFYILFFFMFFMFFYGIYTKSFSNFFYNELNDLFLTKKFESNNIKLSQSLIVADTLSLRLK